MAKIPVHIEKAILAMPQAEKDKLLLRLIIKQPLLVEQLEHKLLGDAEDTLSRREEIREAIKKMAGYTHYETPGWLMMAMRDQSGDIGRHVKVTKDKIGEPLLLLALVNEVFRNQKRLLTEKANRAEKFAEYAVKKAETIVSKLEKIHPDYYTELEDEVNEMLTSIHNYPPCQRPLRATPLPKKWNI
jgi:hypothetical protein